VAEGLFRRGICLPSSSSLTPSEQLLVVNEIRQAAGWPALEELEEEAVAA
jgi:dTDP-4-amino-4,6-dideoxygalactose transaminase